MIMGESFHSTESAEAHRSAVGRSKTSSAQAVTAEQLQAEFDEWARIGWAAELELDNRYLMECAAKLPNLKPGARVLDLSCGSGLATRMIAERLARERISGIVTGLDISPGMLELARHASPGYQSVRYIQGSADCIPCLDGQFDHVVCVESFYYYPDQGRALDEIYRVMARQGRLHLVLRLYSDNPYADEFLTHLSIPAHVRSMAQYVALLTEHGFEDVRASRLPEPRRRRGGSAGVLRRGFRLLARHPTEWAPAVTEKLRIARKRDRAKSIGALLLIAAKP
jgi:ubiquinone/menaquinone biosynthesis C-methylase UbiE